mmetsp:Transcript_71044/g.189624  ORF Transcript_71044/g.189624 Transcript_71044/m.189624 type:complete len:85 (-) Transcript_71044:125-379(-)
MGHCDTRVAKGTRLNKGKGPNIAECIRALLLHLKQQNIKVDGSDVSVHRDNPRLMLLAHCLLILLLRWNKSVSSKQLSGPNPSV